MRNSGAGVRLSLVVTATVAATLLLSGCVGGNTDVADTATEEPTTTSEATTAPETPAPLALEPEGTAADNLEYFTSVTTEFLTAAPDSLGRDIIDHLVAAGFEKSEMELTADTTAVGLDADNIQFSIRMNGTCLIGQYGNVGIHTVAASLLATGTCLVGNTRAIDW